MCGIAGVVHSEPGAGIGDRNFMLRMLGMIRHRGPDQFGIYQDAIATLGSARLSIIDLHGGQQPIANEDESLWIILNGEIFNYLELRDELVRRGRRFRTNTDTEVLLQMYAEHGRECLSKVNGQFAFAIWDARKRTLFAGRDRVGVRPFFYTRVGAAFLFASEVKSLLAYPGVTAKLNTETLRDVFTYWCPLPGQTMFEGIEELPAGHYLNYSPGKVEIKSYWSIQFPAESGTPVDASGESAALEKLQELLTDATRVRLRADVPVGAYLSGGLDSSLIAKIITTGTVSKVATFSIAFDDPQYDESEFQMQMSRALGTRHELIRVTHGDIGRVFPDVVWHTEVPLTRTAPAPLFLLSRLVRDSGFKVVLTGEGSDEFLGGYDIFKEAAIRRFWSRHPDSKLRPLLFRRIYGDIAGLTETSIDFLTAFFASDLADTNSLYYSHMIRWRNNARACRFLSDDVTRTASQRRITSALDGIMDPAFSSWGPLQRAQYVEASLFLPQYLLSSQGDRVAMAHSVEARHPFLDYRVVEFANSLPSRWKLRTLTDKYLLRRMGREMLPPAIWQRPKRPYRAPIHRSFFGPGSPDYIEDILAPDQVRRVGVFKAPAVAQLVRKLHDGKQLGETDDMALAGIVSTQLWHKLFVTGFSADRSTVNLERLKTCGPRFAAAAQ